MDSNLIPFENNDGLEIVIDTSNHNCYASISATARMCQVDKSTISRGVAVAPCFNCKIPFNITTFNI